MHFIRKTGLSLAAIGLLGLAAGHPAQAQIVYDNGAPNQSDGNEMTKWVQAEDFTLGTPTTFDAIRFWDFEGAKSYNGAITYQLYDNNAGKPGAILYAGTTAALTQLATGNSPFGYTEYQDDFSTGPISLNAGTYWLGLHNGTLAQDTRTDFYWETTAVNGTPTGEEDITPFNDNAWFNNGNEHAFQLRATNAPAAPEPSSTATLGVIGLFAAGLILSARKRRSVSTK